jgi:valyl-tRNA synthetase
MPFVTEAIWRNLPLGDDAPARSLMVASWPDTSSLMRFADEGAERSISRLIEIVTGIRGVRARYKIPPKQGVAVVIKTSGDADDQWVNSEFGEMNRLAGVSEFTAGVDVIKPAHSATVIASGMEVYVPLEGLVDFAAEAARLRKERDRLAGDLDKFERKLSNPGFLAKASAEIVEKDRAKAKDLSEALGLIDAQLAELE